tara:strand:- start:741 stop:1295 length:555 start_codon:yes stop_codon:yes gene_type:complete
MATTTKPYGGSGNPSLNNTGTYAFVFPFLRDEDVIVRVDTTDYGYKDGTLGTNEYSVAANSNKTGGTITVNPNPTGSQTLLIYRKTNVDTAKSIFTPGSSIRSVDLNNNATQSLYFAQEVEDSANPKVSNAAGTGTGSSFSISDLNSAFTSKVDGSLIYFDNSASTFKADNTTTKSTIVDGGSF